MHRRPLIALLDRYAAESPADAETRDRLRAFVLRCPRCFDRELAEGHVTGSAWIVDPPGTSVLLTHHRKLGRWLQLGGHSDGDPDVLQTALREAREESGIDSFAPVSTEIFDVDIHEIPRRGEVSAHFHYDVRFALRAISTELTRADAESLDLKWIRLDDLASLTGEESLLRMARKWSALQS